MEKYLTLRRAVVIESRLRGYQPEPMHLDKLGSVFLWRKILCKQAYEIGAKPCGLR
jgi:hypothetical protein